MTNIYREFFFYFFDFICSNRLFDQIHIHTHTNIHTHIWYNCHIISLVCFAFLLFAIENNDASGVIVDDDDEAGCWCRFLFIVNLFIVIVTNGYYCYPFIIHFIYRLFVYFVVIILAFIKFFFSTYRYTDNSIYDHIYLVDVFNLIMLTLLCIITNKKLFDVFVCCFWIKLNALISRHLLKFKRHLSSG